MKSDNRNWISFVLISAIILIAYQIFILEPQMKRARACTLTPR